ncbi:hypothetical protein OIO90_005933 [Microbotryomycetes sp. JL221]|nr:hypothetical protein OIO90_005933 [Microbotryomycetes sp. JL221]
MAATPVTSGAKDSAPSAGRLNPSGPQPPNNGPAEFLHLVSHTSDSTDGSSSGDWRKANVFDVSVAENAAQDGRLDAAGSDLPAWLDQYAQGGWRPDVPPQPPAAISALLEQTEPNQSGAIDQTTNDGGPRMPDRTMSGGSVDTMSSQLSCSGPVNNSAAPTTFTIYPESASSPSELSSMESRRMSDSENILRFFKKHRYLPGPKGAFEEERLRTMRRYDLQDPQRRASINRICRLAKNRFKSNTIIITLVHRDHSVLAAEAGFDSSGVDPGPEDPVRVLHDLNMSLCTHGILRTKRPTTPQDAFVVPDLTKDWRFAHNPQSILEGGSLGFYASASIHLPTAKSSNSSVDVPETMPVGSICVLSDKVQSDGFFTSEDRLFLIDCAEMCAREFDLGREHQKRVIEQRQSDYLGQLVQDVLVAPLSSQISHVAPSTAAVQEDLSTRSTSALNGSFDQSIEQFLRLTGADAAAVLDLRSYRSPLRRPESRNGPSLQRTPPAMYAQATPLMVSAADAFQKGTLAGETLFRTPNAKGRIYLMAAKGDIAWHEVMRDQEKLALAVGDSLSTYYENNQSRFDSGTVASPLGAVLPANVMASCVLPIFDNSVPQLLVVLTSSDRLFQFDEPDIKFANVVGSVLASALLRERALAVDRAKLAFVSQISHELRAPLHSVTSQLELIREFSAPHELRKLAPMLDVCDVCLESLRDVLDDTLDFAKQTSAPAIAPKLVKADLASLAEDVIKATWVRKRRSDLVANDALGETSGHSEGIDVILQVEEREGGWSVWVDTGGLKRVLLNLLGNALKFTEKGHVKLSLRSRRPEDSPVLPSKRAELEAIIIEVEDTGRGMDENFLREGKLFTPFVQADPFANGAGLGMSITQQIVTRMGGKIDVVSSLGQGTCMRVILPLEFTPASTPSSPLAPTPYEEDAQFDFSQAVNAAQEALGSKLAASKLARIPSSKRKQRQQPVIDDRASPHGIVDDVARLALSRGATSPPLAPQKSATVNGHHEDLKQTTKAVAGTKVNVLFADDNSVARSILAKLFTGKGIPHTAATNGQEAVDAYKNSTSPFHLFVADVQMPIKDGIEASYDIREYELSQGLPRCRIMALTGLNNEVDMQKAGVLSEDGPIDFWVTKGGKSLRTILDEIASIQAELDAADESIELQLPSRTHVARKGPPCLACGSTRYHRDKSSGSLVCQEGHILQGYVNESNEQDIGSQPGAKTATLRAQRLKRLPGDKERRQSSSKAAQHFHGQRAGFLLWQTLQWVLRVQVDELIKPASRGGHFEWPVELEAITRDLWAMYMASVGVRDAPRDFAQGQEPATSYAGAREGMDRSKPKRRRTKIDEGKLKRKREDEDGVVAEDEDEEDVDGELAPGKLKRHQARRHTKIDDEMDLDSDDDDGDIDTESETEPDADDEDNGEDPDAALPQDEETNLGSPRPYEVLDDLPQTKARKHYTDNPRERPRMDALLAIIYLACTTLRLPVFLSDIAHFAETHQILYINAKSHIPNAMLTHLNSDSKILLDPKRIRRIFVAGEACLMSFTQQLVKMYKEDWGVLFPEPNLQLLSWRLCRSLACPRLLSLADVTPGGAWLTSNVCAATFYVFLKRLCGLIPGFSLSVYPAVRTRAKNLEHVFPEPAEQVLAAALVLVARLVYNLDAPQNQTNSSVTLEGLPDVDRWLSAIREIQRVHEGGDISSLWAKRADQMTNNEIDAYLDFFEKRIAPSTAKPTRLQDIERFFPLPSASGAEKASSSPIDKRREVSERVDQILSQLFSSKETATSLAPILDEDSSSAKPYLQYVPSETSIYSMPSQLSTVIKHAARLVGTTPYELQLTLSKLETKLCTPIALSKCHPATAHGQTEAQVLTRHRSSTTATTKSVLLNREAIRAGLVRFEAETEDESDATVELSRRSDSNGSNETRHSVQTDQAKRSKRFEKYGDQYTIKSDNADVWSREQNRRAELRKVIEAASRKPRAVTSRPITRMETVTKQVDGLIDVNSTKPRLGERRSLTAPEPQLNIAVKSKAYISSSDEE